MNQQFKICDYCARGYSRMLLVCPHCGHSGWAKPEGNPFWSGQYQGVRSPIDIPAGSRLQNERFIIKEPLGQGRWASVYLAHDHLRNLDVALKLIPMGPASNTDHLNACQQEMELHATLTDLSHVIHLFDAHVIPWQGVSLLLLAMEYADGGCLRQWLNQNRRDRETRIRAGLDFFLQACRGYQAIHAVGAVHLDTKPENLLFAGGVLKVSDLGAAYLSTRSDVQGVAHDRPSSLEMGTPVYMSPEQFRVAHPADLDHRSDIYSLGVVLYELLSPGCRPPFAGSLERVRDCHINVKPARLNGIEPHLADAVEKCLAKDPADRFQSVKDLIEALTEPLAPQTVIDDDYERLFPEDNRDKYQEAVSCFQNGELAEAAALLEQVLTARPDHSQARRLNRDVQARFQSAEHLYTEAATLIGQGDMDMGLSRVEQAMELYPEHPESTPVLAKAKSQSRLFAEYMESATEALRNGLWDKAAALFERALQLDNQAPNVVEVLHRINQIRQARGNMHEALMRSDFSLAGELAGLVDSLAEQLLESLPAVWE